MIRSRGRCSGAPQVLQASIPYQHRPVLLAETLDLLEPKPGDLVVDGTIGGGGHAAALLERIGPAGRLVGLDVDDEALLEAGRRLGSPGDARVTLVRASFRELPRVLSDLGIARIDRLLRTSVCHPGTSTFRSGASGSPRTRLR